MRTKCLESQACSRRDFLAITGAGLAAALVPFSASGAEDVARKAQREIVLFSKVYQTLKLNYAEAAALTLETGLNGLDVPVRPGGEVLPERVEEDLPKYFETLRAKGLSLPMIATAITDVRTPQAELVLRTARKLGIAYYRLGPKRPEAGASIENQVREYHAQLKDLADMNRQIGITGVLQNHSPSGNKPYFGGDLAQARQLLEAIDPAQVGFVFDIGHALVVHGDQWRKMVDPLKPQIRLIYLKDVKRPAQWVPMGQGEIRQSGFLDLLKELNYQGPVSVHIEYDWEQKGATKTREALAKALQEDVLVLRDWFKRS